jgi:hypothetical protein
MPTKNKSGPVKVDEDLNSIANSLGKIGKSPMHKPMDFVGVIRIRWTEIVA